MKIVKLLVLILLLSLLVACRPPDPIENEYNVENTNSISIDDVEPLTVGIPPNGRIYRYIDNEANVVCWIYSYRGGIFCLPLSETTLQ